jgi:hypothetical protein
MSRGQPGEPRVRGLPSLEEARAERRRAIVFGKARLRALPPQFWLLSATVIAAFGVVYWRLAEGQLEGQKGTVMAKQRAMAQALGPEILPVRDRIEGWVKELAGPYSGDHVKPGLPFEVVTRSPGVYLRLRSASAGDEKAIRQAARRSLHDGFTSCFFVRGASQDPTQGPACKALADCDPGLLCNEWNVCALPPEPFNMRLLYRALRVLSSEWTDELHETTNDLAVSAYDRDLDAVTKNDVPVAARVLKRAKFFTLVLDDDPPGGVPPEPPDGGLGETDEERVQRKPHTARVGIWSLETGEQLLRVRREAAGRFIPVGDAVVKNAASIAAQERQTNSCTLALAVKEAAAGGNAPAPATSGVPAAASAKPAPGSAPAGSQSAP